MLGAKFLYKGKEYVLIGQITNGKYYKAYGSDKNFPANECRIIKYKSRVSICRIKKRLHPRQ